MGLQCYLHSSRTSRLSACGQNRPAISRLKTPFIMCLGDNVTGQGISSFVQKFKKEQLDALIILKEVDDPSRFGIAQLTRKAT